MCGVEGPDAAIARRRPAALRSPQRGERMRKAFRFFAIGLVALCGAGGVAAADVLFVVGDGRAGPGDKAIEQHLRQRGVSVLVKRDRTVAAQDAAQSRLVLISASVDARQVRGKFMHAEVAVIASESQLFDDLGMTAHERGVDYGESRPQRSMAYSDAGHLLLPGPLPGGVMVSRAPTALAWGKPGPLAIRIAHVRDHPDQSTFFVYPAGAAMPGLDRAPAKRVGFFLARDAAGSLTPAGWSLFDRAVDWALLLEDETCGPGFTQRLTLINSCGDDVWMIETPPGSRPAVQAQWDWWKTAYGEKLKIAKGATASYCVPDKGAPGGNFRFYTGCDAQGNNCIIGAPIGDLAGINTLFEPTFGCKPGLGAGQCAFNPAAPADACRNNPGADTCPALESADNFDISAVDGYTLPMRLDVQGNGCNRPSTDASMLDLASCPQETAATLHSTNAAQQAVIQGGIDLVTKTADGKLRACSSPCKWFTATGLGTPPNPVLTPPVNGCPLDSSCFYCCGGQSTCPNDSTCPACGGAQCKIGPRLDGSYAIDKTAWVTRLSGMGYEGYTWAYGDGEGDQACNWGARITLTLCPRGGVPYRAEQKWAASGGKCLASDAGQHASLADCQRSMPKQQ